MEVRFEVIFQIDGDTKFEREIKISNSDSDVIKSGLIASIETIHGICMKEIKAAF